MRKLVLIFSMLFLASSAYASNLGTVLLSHSININNYLGVTYMVTDKRGNYRNYSETFRGTRLITSTPPVLKPWAFVQIREVNLDGRSFSYTEGECEAWISPGDKIGVQVMLSRAIERSGRPKCTAISYRIS